MEIDKQLAVYNCIFLFLQLTVSLGCPEPPPVANAYRVWKGTGQVSYSCLFGYIHTGGHLTRDCDFETGTYTGEPPVCTLECEEPADVVGAVRVYSNDTRQGSNANYTCWSNYTPFYTRYRPPTRTCSVTYGGWTEMPIICSAPDNMAIGLTTSQSSTKGAVHGTTYNSFNALRHNESCSSTNDELNPWWTVSFGTKFYNIYNVFVTFSTEFKGTVTVYVMSGSDAHERVVCGEEGVQTPVEYTATCDSNVYGNAINITAAHTDPAPLSICTVQVTGYVAHQHTVPHNLAIGRNTTQSTTMVNEDEEMYGSKNAVKNSTSCSSTDFELRPSWTLSFGVTLYDVYSVKVYLQSVELYRTDENMTVHVKYGKAPDERVLCEHDGVDTSMTFTAQCKNYVYGYEVQVSAVYPDPRPLQICYVEILGRVHGFPRNLATGQDTSQSSNLPSSNGQTYGSKNAVDNAASCSSTMNEFKPWWRLSFGSTFYNIHWVSVFLPSVDFDSPDINVSVHVVYGNTLDERVLCEADGYQTPPMFKANCDSSVYGHLIDVSVQFPKKQALKICDVEVLGELRESPANLATEGNASQSTTLTVDYRSQNALDSDYFYSSTEDELNPWWKVSFGSTLYDIYDVIVYFGSMEFHETNVNVTVKYGEDSDEHLLCEHSVLESTSVFQCGNYVYGYEVEMAVAFPEKRSLKIVNFVINGRLHGTPGNLAVGNNVTQSTTVIGGDSQNAVNYTASCSCTKKELNPWWLLSFTSSTYIHLVNVFMPTVEFDKPGVNVSVYVINGRDSDQRFLCEHDGVKTPPFYTAKCDKYGGQINVTVEYQDPAPLKICDIQILGGKLSSGNLATRYILKNWTNVLGGITTIDDNTTLDSNYCSVGKQAELRSWEFPFWFDSEIYDFHHLSFVLKSKNESGEYVEFTYTDVNITVAVIFDEVLNKSYEDSGVGSFSNYEVMFDSDVFGHGILITVEFPEPELLKICDVRILGRKRNNVSNLATEGNTSQSTTLTADFSSQNAVYGNTSCSSTEYEVNPWWKLSFGSTLYDIYSVIIEFEFLEFFDGNINVYVRYGNEPDDQFLCYTDGNAMSETFTAICHSYTYGFQVEVLQVFNRSAPLKICGVNILGRRHRSFGTLINTPTTNQSSTQSSTQSLTMSSNPEVIDDKESFDSANAVDGTASCSATEEELNPYWTLSLGSVVYDIHRINVMLPSIEFNSLDVNITVHIVYGNQSHERVLCDNDVVETPPMFTAKCDSNVHGYQIEVAAVFKSETSLKICDVEIFGRIRHSLENLAMKGNTSQTTTKITDVGSQNAVDDSNSSCSSTANEVTPSWTLSFNSTVYDVHRVSVLLQSADADEKMTVHVLNGAGERYLCELDGDLTHPMYLAKCDRYVYGDGVQITAMHEEARPLRICNVEIIGELSVNLASGRETFQSTTLAKMDDQTYDSVHAVDDTDSCSSTEDEVMPSWTLSFGTSLYYIYMINIRFPQEFMRNNVSITVYVIYGKTEDERYVCEHNGLEKLQVVTATCDVDVYGYKVQVTATYHNNPGPLKICNVEIRGRYLGSPAYLIAERSTLQSSTLDDNEKKHGSYNAVDGTESCSSTKPEMTPSWQLTFASKPYDIHLVTVHLPGTKFNLLDVNVTVLVIHKDVSYPCSSIRSVPPVFLASCDNRQGSGISVHVHNYYNETSLKICKVEIFGREIGSGCDRPVVEVGKRFVYSSTRFEAVVADYCDSGGSFYYQGGNYSSECSKSDSYWNRMRTECGNDENIVSTSMKTEDLAAVLDNDVNTCIHKLLQTQHLWPIDLREEYEIRIITISVPVNASDVKITIEIKREKNGMSKSCTQMSHSFYLLNDTRTTAYSCYGNPYGQYIRLSADVDVSYLSLCEVRAFGRRQIDKPRECLESTNSREYKGNVNFTVLAQSCIRWDNVTDLQYPISDFPDYSLEEAGNSCRNPGSSRKQPWCYTSVNKDWGYCPLLYCKHICTFGKHGDQYRGSIGKTRSGLQCQKWIKDKPHKHAFKLKVQFPDRTSHQAYCRNPLASQTRPWCFTTNSSHRYETCNIPPCHTRFDVFTAQIGNESSLEHFKNQDGCYYWDTPKSYQFSSQSDHLLMMCKSNSQNFSQIVVLCYKWNGNSFQWKYIHLDCVMPTPPTTPNHCSTVPYYFNLTANETVAMCRCQRRYTPIEVKEIKSTAEKLFRDMLLNKKILSKYRRLFYSVPDDRLSSMGLGTTSVIIVSVVTVFITSQDILCVLHWMFLKICHKAH